MHQIVKRQFFQRAFDHAIDNLLVVFDRAAALKITDHICAAVGQRHRAFDGSDDVGNGYFLCIARQAVAALYAAMRHQKAALLQYPQQLAHGWNRKPRFQGQVTHRVQSTALVAGHMAHQHQSVIRKFAESDHSLGSAINNTKLVWFKFRVFGLSMQARVALEYRFCCGVDGQLQGDLTYGPARTKTGFCEGEKEPKGAGTLPSSTSAGC